MTNKYGSKVKYFFIAFMLIDVLLAVMYIDDKVLSKTKSNNTGMYDVLFGSPAKTSYNESVPVSQGFTSSNIISTYTRKANTKKVKSNLNADYHVKPNSVSGDYLVTTVNNQSNTDFASGYSSFASHTEVYASNKNNIISTNQPIKSLDVPLMNNIGVSNLQNIALAENPVANYEPFSDILGTANDNRFNMSQVDPGEEDPEGNPIPVPDGWEFLLLLAVLWGVFKNNKRKMLKLNKWSSAMIQLGLCYNKIIRRCLVTTKG